jgi:4-hydroxy-3-methylbut-2-enyl diphosphate reductase
MTDLTVLTPLSIEARAVRSGLLAAGAQVRVVHTGMGHRRSRRAVEDLRRREGDRATGPLAVAGFCGALDPALRPGDVVVASEVRGPSGTLSLPSSGLVVAALARSGIPAHLGPIVSTERLVRGEALRALATTGAIAVDMESAWLAEAARGRPLAVVRVVSDTIEKDLLTHPFSTARGGIQAYRALKRAAPALTAWASAAGPRRILLAGPRSFCAGVERAIEIVERALERYGAPVFVRKQIVHNVHVVHDLEERGAVFVDELDEVPRGALVVFSAHGVSPQVKAEAQRRGLRVIDATCPLVTKVHTEARRFAQAGYSIFLIGHDGHEEVEGTTGEAPTAIRLVQPEHDEEDVAGIAVTDPGRVAYLTQTTLAVDEVQDVVSHLRERFPLLAGPGSEDICYATQNRQDAVKDLARACEVLLVIGSTNSSNSKRLVEVAEREGCTAWLVDDETDIDPAWLAGVSTVGLTAGASAPEVLVDRVVAALAHLGEVSVEEHQVVSESVRFTLPVELRWPGEAPMGRMSRSAAAKG